MKLKYYLRNNLNEKRYSDFDLEGEYKVFADGELIISGDYREIDALSYGYGAKFNKARKSKNLTLVYPSGEEIEFNDFRELLKHVWILSADLS